MANSEQLARMFQALSAKPRVRIVQLLGRQTLCVNALARRLGISQAAVSQHLRVLRDAGLVTAEKRGYYVHYSLNRRTVRAWHCALAELLDAEQQPCPTEKCPERRSDDV